MTEYCERCGPVHEGAELRATAHGTLCLVCLDYVEDNGGLRGPQQHALEDYTEP